jgi:hypothetical protein
VTTGGPRGGSAAVPCRPGVSGFAVGCLRSWSREVRGNFSLPHGGAGGAARAPRRRRRRVAERVAVSVTLGCAGSPGADEEATAQREDWLETISDATCLVVIVCRLKSSGRSLVGPLESPERAARRRAQLLFNE